VLGCWEKPEGPAGDGWQVDRVAVDAAVHVAFQRSRARVYADPPHFQDFVDQWLAEFGPRLRVRASAQRPMEWWTNRPKAMVDALERFHGHDGSSLLTRHILNARRRVGRLGITTVRCWPCRARSENHLGRRGGPP
jgi:hypothetical protein